MPVNNIFYDGSKLLEKKDLKGNIPEIYITSGNRTAGKSYFWKKYLLDRWIADKHQKVMLLFRKADELAGCLDAYMKDLKEQNPEYRCFDEQEETESRGLYKSLFLSGNHFGYAAPLTGADKIRKKSTVFVDVAAMFFDEFQSETEDYLPGEVDKFISIHVSVARGGGKHVRYVPVYMSTNNISLLNPYYVSMGIYNRLNSKTRFLRGDGYVMEVTHNEVAAQQMEESGFNRAFRQNSYLDMAKNNTYLLDNDTFIEKRNTELCEYQATILCDGKRYGVWLDRKDGVLYCSTNTSQKSFLTYATSLSDHSEVSTIATMADPVIKVWRTMFQKAKWRFESLICKKVIIDTMARNLL